MADIGKFIFTDEGKRMIVAQDGGIHFAVMGAVLLNNDTLTESIVKDLTWEQLKDGEYGTLAMKGVNYLCNGSNILPEDDLTYNSAINDIFARSSKTENTYLFDCRYHPDMGVKDKDGLCYGMYDFNFNKTMLMWTGDAPSFNAIIVLGKQYVTDKDSTYSVADSQKPTVVGAIISVPDEETEETGETKPLVEFMADQNEYVEFKFQWRITFTDNPVINGNVGLNADVLADINDKFQLTNNGLKTNDHINLNITTDDKIINEFNLNVNGNFATSKSVMVAQESPSDELDFQFNNNLLNTVNCGQKDAARYPSSEGSDELRYKDHRTLYSFAYEGKITDIGETPITGAAMVETLRSTEPMTNTHPVYTPTPLSIPYNNKEKAPVYETRVINANVSLFGINEFIDTTGSRAIFSEGNLKLLGTSLDHKATFIYSNNNFEYNNTVTDNVYIGSNSNTAHDGSTANNFINSNYNETYSGAHHNMLIHSNNNTMYNSTNNDIFIGSNANSAYNGIENIVAIQCNNNKFEDGGHSGVYINSHDNWIHNSGGKKSVLINTVSSELYNSFSDGIIIAAKEFTATNGAASAVVIGEEKSLLTNSTIDSFLAAGYNNIITDSSSGTTILASNTNNLATVKDVTIINGHDNGYNDAGRTSYYCRNLQDSVILNSRNTDIFSWLTSPYGNKTVINGVGIKGNSVSIKGAYTGHEVYFGQYNAVDGVKGNDLMPIIVGGGRNDKDRYNALTFELLDSINEGKFAYSPEYNYLGRLSTDVVYCKMGLSADIAEVANTVYATNVQISNNLTVDNGATINVGGTTLQNYIDNEIEQKVKPNRTFYAEIFVHSASVAANDSFTPCIGLWYDTGATTVRESKMYQALQSWIDCGLFGYGDTSNNDPDEDSYYYINGACKQAATIGLSPVEGSYAKFGFANDNTSDYKYPYMYGIVPAGYSLVELTVHFLDVGNSDYIFPLIPITPYFSELTRFKINIVGCEHPTSNDGSEHFHCWQFKRYIPDNSESRRAASYDNLFKLRETLGTANPEYEFTQHLIADGFGMPMECRAVPVNSNENKSMFVNHPTPISIGWKILRTKHVDD